MLMKLSRHLVTMINVMDKELANLENVKEGKAK